MIFYAKIWLNYAGLKLRVLWRGICTEPQWLSIPTRGQEHAAGLCWKALYEFSQLEDKLSGKATEQKRIIEDVLEEHASQQN